MGFQLTVKSKSIRGRRDILCGEQVSFEVKQSKPGIAKPVRRIVVGSDQDFHVSNIGCTDRFYAHVNGVAQVTHAVFRSAFGGQTVCKGFKRHGPCAASPRKLGTGPKILIEIPCGNGGFTRPSIGQQSARVFLGVKCPSTATSDHRKHEAQCGNSPLHLRKRPAFWRSSAIWMALIAAPLRRLSATIQRCNPCTSVKSRRIRPTKTSSFPAALIGMG